MKKQDYFNTIGLQIKDLLSLSDLQRAKCFDAQKLADVLMDDQARTLKRVVLTGCGDSFSAAGSMLEAFCLYSGLSAVSVPDPMEFCRFYTHMDVTGGFREDETLVVAISASGGSERIVEMMDKGNEHGVATMLITNNPESKGAKAAKHVFHVETPEGCNSPGLRSYYASMIAIVALGAYIGVKRGHISAPQFEQAGARMAEYTKAVLAGYESMDDQMFELATQWKDYPQFELIADNVEGSSAQFVEEKFIECAGVHCTHTDSEDWCHINHFLRETEKTGTIVMVNSQAPDFDRMLCTIQSAAAIHRPLLIVTDADAALFPQEAHVCVIPPAETWLMPIIDFAPGSMLAAYTAAVSDKLFFCGRYDFRTQKWTM